MTWQPPITFESALLLVEGKEEVVFFEEFIKHHHLKKIQTLELGKYSFRDRFLALTVATGFADTVTSIGVVRDADDSAENTFISICDVLKAAKLPVPANILSPTNTSPSINIIIMPPDGSGTGRMLEDICMASVLDDPAIACMDQYFDCLQAQGITLRENVIAKARVHVFLASREEPDRRLGEAAKSGYWNFDSPVFDKVKAFLQQVTNP